MVPHSLSEKNWSLGYVRDEARAQEDVEIHYGATGPLGDASAEVIWKNKYVSGTSSSISSLRPAYYVYPLFKSEVAVSEKRCEAVSSWNF